MVVGSVTYKKDFLVGIILLHAIDTIIRPIIPNDDSQSMKICLAVAANIVADNQQTGWCNICSDRKSVV